jgi:hypothetical protein
MIMQVRDIVLGHVVPQKLTFDDLKALPGDEVVPTLLKGNVLKLSSAGSTSGSNAGETGSRLVSLLKGDIDACAPNSTMHTIRALLPIANLALPPTAAPRNIAVSCFCPLVFISMCCFSSRPCNMCNLPCFLFHHYTLDSDLISSTSCAPCIAILASFLLHTAISAAVTAFHHAGSRNIREPL